AVLVIQPIEDLPQPLGALALVEQLEQVRGVARGLGGEADVETDAEASPKAAMVQEHAVANPVDPARQLASPLKALSRAPHLGGCCLHQILEIAVLARNEGAHAAVDQPEELALAEVGPRRRRGRLLRFRG